MPLRPRKKTKRRARNLRCKRCGGQIRRKIGSCKRCSQKHP